MDENIKCVALLFVSLMVYEYDVICGESLHISDNNLACLEYAGDFYEHLQSSFCNGSNQDMNVWHQNHEECNKICTIKTHSLPCSDPDYGVRAQFHFNVNLPVNAYNFGTCKSCLNITQIIITCMLGIRSTATEPNSTQNEEITTPKIISKSSGDKVEIIVAAIISGAVFGSLVTIGVWILKQKYSKDQLWAVDMQIGVLLTRSQCRDSDTQEQLRKRRSTVQNPTYNDSPRPSDPQPEPAVSTGNKNLEIAPQNNQSYNPKEDSGIYNHLNEKTENTEDTESPYDHAQYQQNQPDTILDSDYMHINKVS